MKCFTTVLALVFAVAATVANPLATYSTSHTDDISPTSIVEDKLAILAQALKYGDSCDPSVEDYRNNLTRIMMDYPTTSLATMLDESTAFAIKMTANNDPMCNAKRQLICGPSSTCVCGDPGMRSLRLRQPLQYKRDGSHCVRPKNTACLPNDNDGIENCEAGSMCRVRADGRTCTTQVWKSFGVSRVLNGKKIGGAMKEFLDNKVCTCVPHDEIRNRHQTDDFAVAPIEDFQGSQDTNFHDIREQSMMDSRGSERTQGPADYNEPAQNHFDESTPRTTQTFHGNNLDEQGYGHAGRETW